jgi:ParB family chromosome partitioning protein
MSHVRPLLSLRDEDQIYEAAQQVLKQKMSVREVEAYVHNLSGTEVKPQKKKIHTEKDPWIRDLENRMQQKLSTGVSVSKKSITISYTDTEDLNRILDLLGCIEESNM